MSEFDVVSTEVDETIYDQPRKGNPRTPAAYRTASDVEGSISVKIDQIVRETPRPFALSSRAKATIREEARALMRSQPHCRGIGERAKRYFLILRQIEMDFEFQQYTLAFMAKYGRQRHQRSTASSH